MPTKLPPADLDGALAAMSAEALREVITVRELPTEVVLGRRQGLPGRRVANLDNVLTIPRQRLNRLMGACDSEKLAELNEAIKEAFDVR